MNLGVKNIAIFSLIFALLVCKLPLSLPSPVACNDSHPAVAGEKFYLFPRVMERACPSATSHLHCNTNTNTNTNTNANTKEI